MPCFAFLTSIANAKRGLLPFWNCDLPCDLSVTTNIYCTIILLYRKERTPNGNLPLSPFEKKRKKRKMEEFSLNAVSQ